MKNQWNDYVHKHLKNDVEWFSQESFCKCTIITFWTVILGTFQCVYQLFLPILQITDCIFVFADKVFHHLWYIFYNCAFKFSIKYYAELMPLFEILDQWLKKGQWCMKVMMIIIISTIQKVIQIKREWNATANIEYEFVCIQICESAGVMIFHKQMKREMNIWKWMFLRKSKLIGS